MGGREGGREGGEEGGRGEGREGGREGGRRGGSPSPLHLVTKLDTPLPQNHQFFQE